MPTAQVNGIEINYRLEGSGDETIVLVNGLADEVAQRPRADAPERARDEESISHPGSPSSRQEPRQTHRS